MSLSLNQAAKQGRVAKTSLLRALKSGEISGVKDNSGQWQIDEAELVRWSEFRSTKPREDQFENRLDPPEKPAETSVLEREIELLRERLNDKDDVIADLRDRLDRETNEREKLTALLLTDQREKSPTEPTPEPWFKLGPLRIGGRRKGSQQT